MSRTLFAILLAVLVVCKASAQTQLQNDLSFNSRGYKMLTEPVTGWAGFKMCTGTDGSIYVAGSHGSDSLSIWKLKANGEIDGGFGKGGYQSLYLNGFSPSAFHFQILLQRDDKVVAMADGKRVTIPANNTESAIVLARLNKDGSPDLSFNGSGLLIHQPDADYQFSALALAIDSTGSTDKFFVSSLAVEIGNASCPTGMGKWCISKYNNDGSLDRSFNQKGYLLESASFISNSVMKSPLALVLDLRVKDNGQLLAAGAYHAEDSAYFMLQLKADGSKDTEFGNAGGIKRPIGGVVRLASDQRTSAKIQHDGSVIFASHVDVYGASGYDSSVLYLVKSNGDGSSVMNYGNGGTLMCAYVAEGHHQYSLDQEGKVLVYWNQNAAGKQLMQFRSYGADGQANWSFGKNGYMSLEPIQNDQVLYTTLYDALWTKDNQELFVLSRRFDHSNKAHIGLFKYAEVMGGTNTTAVKSIEELQLTIKPQPAHNYIDISLVKGGTMKSTVFNAQGQIVYQDQSVTTGTKRIPVSNLPRGNYFLRVGDANGRVVTKSIVLE